MITSIVALVAFVGGVLTDHFLESKIRANVANALARAGSAVANPASVNNQSSAPKA